MAKRIKAGASLSEGWTVDRLLRDQGWATEMRKAGVGPLTSERAGQVPKGPGVDDRD